MRTLHHAGVIAALGLCGWAATYALVRALEHRVPFTRLYGSTWAWITVALVVALLCVMGALVQWGVAWRRGRWSGAALAPYRWIVSVALGGQVAFLALAQPFQRLHFDLALGLTAGLYGLVLLAEGSRPSRPRGRPLRVIEFAVFQLALFWAGAEVCLRVWARLDPAPILSLGGAETRDLIEGFRPKPGEMRLDFPFNSGGHYDGEFRRKQPGERLVASIGDSFAQGVVPLPYHYTSVCERALGVPVYNFGIPSVGLPEYLWLLRHEALLVDPDFIVVCLFVGNDLRDSPNKTPTDRALRRWFDRENVAAWIVPQRLWTVRRAARELREGGGGVEGGAPVAAPSAGEDGEMAWLADPMLERPTIPQPRYLDIEVHRALEIAREGERDYDYIATYLRALREAAGEIGIGFVIIPDEFQVDDELWRTILADPLTEGVEFDRDLPQRKLSAWFEEEGVPYLDLLPVLRAVAPLADGRPHVYHKNDTHLNARGNRAAGEALAEFVRAHYPD